MADLATAYISIVPEMRGVKSGINKAFKGVDAEGKKAGKAAGDQFSREVDSAASKAGKSLSGAFKIGAVAGVAVTAASALTGGLSSLASGALRASDATDKFKQTLDFAGLDTKAIDAATKSAQAYADATVYELADIQNMTAQLAANGVDDYMGLAEAAGNLNAVAGGNVDTFKSVGMVMSQTAGAGKLTTENWNQLADAIPGASGQIQSALSEAGAYTGNFRDAMADGEITAEEFNAAVMKLGSEPIAQEAAASTATFEGMVGNLQAALEGGLANAFTQLKPHIEPLVNGLTTLAETAIPALATGLSNAISGMITFGTWVQNNSTWLIPLGVGLGVVTAAMAALNLQQTIMAAGGLIQWFTSLTMVTNLQAAAMGLLNIVTAANPFVLLGIAIAGVVAGLTYFFTQTETGRAIWQSFTTALTVGWNAVVVALSAGWNFIKTVVFAAWQFYVDQLRMNWAIFAGVVRAIWSGLSAALVATWNYIKMVVFLGFQGALAALRAVFGAVVGALRAMWDGFKSALIAVWNVIRAAVFGAFTAALNGLRNVTSATMSAASGAWNILKTAAVNVVGAVRTKIQEMLNFIGQVPGKVSSAFADAGSWLFNAGKNIINGLINGIKSMFGQVGNAIGSILPEKVRGFAGFADGGVAYSDGGVRFYRNGGREKHQAQIAKAGEWRVWAESETGGEAYIPLATSKRGRSTKILANVADHFGLNLTDKNGKRIGSVAQSQVAPAKTQYFADGGVTGAKLKQFALGQRVNGHQAGRSLEGAPYNWGGVNWGDCSGTMSAFARFVAGISPFGGRFATGNQAEALTSLGFRRGRGGAGDMRIGFKNGGPAGGHTAGTLPDGTNVEMGGGRGNGQIGGGAAGAWDSYFDQFFYRKVAQPKPPKMNKMEPLNKVPNADMSLSGDLSPVDEMPSTQAQMTVDTGTETKEVEVKLTPDQAAKATVGKALGEKTLLEWGTDGIFDILGMNDSITKELLTTKGSDFMGSDDIVTTGKARTSVAKKHAETIETQAAQLPVAKVENDPQLSTEQVVEKKQKAKPKGPTWGPVFFAKEIARKAKSMGLDRQAAKIGLATALVESGNPLKMWANRAVPESLKYRHDAVGSDYDSVGLFQQRDNGAWGTVKQRMTPFDSAGLFFNVLKGFDYRSMDPGAAAQKVQVSAFPNRYSQQMGAADDLLKRTGVFDRGGLANGLGYMRKETIQPERVLSPQQTKDFGRLVDNMPRGGQAAGSTIVVNLDNEELLRRRIDSVNGRVEINTSEIKRLVDAKRPLATARTRGGVL